MKTKLNTFRILWALLAVLGSVFVSSCRYERDRFDEQVITQTSEQYDLYRQEPAQELSPLFCCSAGKSVDYRISLDRMMLKTADAPEPPPESYAIVSLCWEKQPPLVEFFQPDPDQPNRKRPVFSIPLTRTNVVFAGEKEGKRLYHVALSLRFDTLLPILKKNNYEIFLLTLQQDVQDQTWELTGFKMLTNGKLDAIQPMFNADGSKVAFVINDRKMKNELYLVDADGGNPVKVASNATLPFFLPDGRLLFVKQRRNLMQEFRVYNPATGGKAAADDADICFAVRALPYSALKQQYMQLDHLRDNRMPDALNRKMTVEEVLNYAMRNSPEIQAKYYTYLAAGSQSTQNLYDIGPDFFFTADYLATSDMFTNSDGQDYTVIGDRIGQNNFMRLMTGLSIPVIPNLPLRWATRYRYDWEVEQTRSALLQQANKTIGDVMVTVFDYTQNTEVLELIKRQIRLNDRRLERYRKQNTEGDAYQERILFARNIGAGLRSELNVTAEEVLSAQTRLAARLGINDSRGISLQLPDKLDQLLPPQEELGRSPEFFQAQARLNRQELRAINCQIAQLAATRDMGPENTRIDALRISVGYGLGILQWQQFVDDFLLLGTSYARPLRLPIVARSYYDDYTGRILSLRMQKYALEGTISEEVQETWKDYIAVVGQSNHRECRADFLREQARLARLYTNVGDELFGTPASTVEDMDASLALLEENLTWFKTKYEAWRRLVKLYSVSGRSDLIVPEVIRVFEPRPLYLNPAIGEPRQGTVTGIYLWNSLEIIQSKVKREEFLSLCKEYGINMVYCYASMRQGQPPYLVKYEPEYNYFLECCRRENIQVMVLMGEPDWIYPNQRADFRTLLKAFVAFNDRQLERGETEFFGVKLDVEPHTLPGWETQRDRLLKDYLGMLDEAAGIIGKEHLFVDISYVYNELPYEPNQDFLDALSRRVRGFTIMAYLDTEHGIRKKVIPILKRKDLHCLITAAIETNKLPEHGISFYGKSRAEVMRVVEDCRKAFRLYPNFSGMCIHDYYGFEQMK